MREGAAASPPDATRKPDLVTVGSCLTWTVHPAGRSLARSMLAVGVVIAAGCLVAAISEGVVFGVLSAVLLVVSLRHFFFPTTYVVDERGVAVRCFGVETRRSWSRLRRFLYDAHGAFLSTRATRSALDSFTGLHLTWAGNADEAVQVIEGYMEQGSRRLANRSPPATARAVQRTGAAYNTTSTSSPHSSP